MSIEEKEKEKKLDQSAILPALQPQPGENREDAFARQFSTDANHNLLRPFGTPNWRLFGPLLVILALALLFFTHIINAGKLDVTNTISFGVNLWGGLAIIAIGLISIGPKLVRHPQEIRSQRVLASIILLALLAAFFLLKIVDLGLFTYKLDQLDISSLIGLVLVGGMIYLAFQGSAMAIVALVGLFLWWGFSIEDFGFSTVGDLFNSPNGGRLLRSMFPPKWDYFSLAVDPMLLTVQTAVASTVIGIVVALPLSILAARNTTPHPIIYNIVRFLINTVRAVPSLILALLFIPFVGLGPGAGVLGLALHSVSVLTKLYAEAFESVKPQPLEALNAVGADGLKTFRWGVFPQAFPLVASYSIFNWESNGRDSTVVAFVGGGGIGFLLQQNLSLLNYANVAVLLVVLIITVSILDRFSDFVRSRII